jgi:ABC-type branched-subunit amino acid transport system substrate-binding protein
VSPGGQIADLPAVHEQGETAIMGRTSDRTASARHRRWAVVPVTVLAATVAVCSISVGAASAATYKAPPIPSSAFSDHTGITADSVSIGNVSTLVAGLFKGADVGVQAYADYVNAVGGIYGRKILVDSSDDGYSGGPNKQETQADIQKDVAMVGSFSLEDNFGGQVLKSNPQVPNVSVSLDLATNNLPNTFAVAPSVSGWQLGPLAYFKKKYPAAITHTAAMVAGEPSAIAKWNSEHQAMSSLGYKVVYDPTFEITQTDFNQNVIAMKHDGVKILFLEQMPQNYAAAVVQALVQQDFHPVLVLGGSTYSEAIVASAGGAAAIDGAYMEQNTSLYLGEDKASLPAITAFDTWVQKASPGFKADLYTLYGWLSAELFTEALKAAGPHPSRGSILQQLRKITSFSGGYLVGTSDPATKTPTNCYIIAKIENGKYQRVDDPPVNGSTHGYRCDQPFYYAKP